MPKPAQRQPNIYSSRSSRNWHPIYWHPLSLRGERANVGETILRRLQERFEVKTAKELTVKYVLRENPAFEQTVKFPKFYLQRRVISRAGAVQEAHFTLYIAGEASLSLFDSALDADALGVSLVSVFMDTMSEELAGFFPRITSRYHHCRGNAEEMTDFLHHQLKVSIEAQDMARAIISGQVPEHPPVSPPARFVQRPGHVAHPDPDTRKTFQKQKETSQQQVEDFFHDITQSGDGDQGTSPPELQHSPPRPKPRVPQPGGPTKEQQERGKRGEEELKRRLSLPGGWEGFVLLQDTRDDGCGYDYLCASGGREVNLEIKTFARNGYVSITGNELKVAARNRTDYYMVGVLAEENKPGSDWKTFVICDPINAILQAGTIHIQTEIRTRAADLFQVKQQEEQH